MCKRQCCLNCIHYWHVYEDDECLYEDEWCDANQDLYVIYDDCVYYEEQRDDN